ncbi:MAG: hypothetical protein C0407_15740 [Desulfobacca sp.]|nr:hypothetical protein [Desulfobacca sp.]
MSKGYYEVLIRPKSKVGFDGATTPKLFPRTGEGLLSGKAYVSAREKWLWLPDGQLPEQAPRSPLLRLLENNS